MRDPQTIPAATFDHFDFFFSWVGCSVFFFFHRFVFRSGFFFLFFFHWFGLQLWVFYFIFIFIFYISFSEFGYWKEKKKKKSLYRLTGMGLQIVWKILSDGNWVIMPKGCEKLSDEWWVMSDEWWKLSDQKNEAKQPLIFLSMFRPKGKN